MDEKKITEMGKLVFDTKTIRILETIRNQSLTIKEIAAVIDEKPSNLYYPIKKMLEAELIYVEKEERVKNIIEKHYKSNPIFEEGDTFSFEGEFLEENYQNFVKFVMLEMNKALLNLSDDLSNTDQSESDPEQNTAEFSFTEKKLSYENWKHLNEYIRDYIDEYEENGDSQNAYKFFISSYQV